jgi:hypothetical protein
VSEEPMESLGTEQGPEAKKDSPTQKARKHVVDGLTRIDLEIARQIILRPYHSIRPRPSFMNFTHTSSGYIYVDPKKGGKSLEFIINGRGIWTDITITLSPRSFDPADASDVIAFDTCCKLFDCLKKHKCPSRVIHVGPFMFVLEQADLELWNALAESWSRAQRRIGLPEPAK